MMGIASLYPPYSIYLRGEPPQLRRQRLLHLRQHREAADALVLVGVEERIVVRERDAAVGLAARPEHVAVREQSIAAVDFFLAAERRQPQRRHAVKQRLARL